MVGARLCYGDNCGIQGWHNQPSSLGNPSDHAVVAGLPPALDHRNWDKLLVGRPHGPLRFGYIWLASISIQALQGLDFPSYA